MIISNIKMNMNKIDYLPNDIMSLILNIRTEQNKKDLDKKIKEWKEESENQYIYLTNEIEQYSIAELPIYDRYDNLIGEIKYLSPYEVLKMLRDEKEMRINDTLNNNFLDFSRYN